MVLHCGTPDVTVINEDDASCNMTQCRISFKNAELGELLCFHFIELSYYKGLG